jgi:uncharacterized protein
MYHQTETAGVSFLKLHADANPTLNTVTAYGPGYIEVNRIRFDTAIVFGPEGPVLPWPASTAADISTDLLMQACGLASKPKDPLAFLDSGEGQPTLDPNRPEVLLVGTGTRQVMLSHAITHPIVRVGVGVEVMSTSAAARTYNILMAEGRKVIVALLTETV